MAIDHNRKTSLFLNQCVENIIRIKMFIENITYQKKWGFVQNC